MSKNINACLSHKTDDWKTPTDIYEAFMKNNFVDCFKYQSNENELENDYENQKLFINPPFSKLNIITDWLIRQLNRNQIALLIPARTDTKYFQKLIKYNPIIYFIEGRLHYNDSKSAPFPTILLIFDKYRVFPLYIPITQTQLIKKIGDLFIK